MHHSLSFFLSLSLSFFLSLFLSFSHSSFYPLSPSLSPFLSFFSAFIKDKKKKTFFLLCLVLSRQTRKMAFSRNFRRLKDAFAFPFFGRRTSVAGATSFPGKPVISRLPGFVRASVHASADRSARSDAGTMHSFNCESDLWSRSSRAAWNCAKRGSHAPSREIAYVGD